MIDILYAVILIVAVVKGLKKGLAMAIFSIAAFIIGLAAALKLSAIVAVYLAKNLEVSSKWLPFLSFALVFLVVVVLVNWAGKAVEKTFELAFLGSANRIGGVLVYSLLYTIIYSVLLFYAEKIQILTSESIRESIVFSYIRPWAPFVLDGIGKIIPWFKDSFSQLEHFFEGVANKVSH